MASIILGRVVVEFAWEKSLILNGNGGVDGHARIGNRELKLPVTFHSLNSSISYTIDIRKLLFLNKASTFM